MAITKEVNVHLLNECFELRPFHGLCKPHPHDVLAPQNDDEEEENGENPQGKLFFNYFIIILFILIFFM